MKYCYDTEFLEDGSTIDLISIGIVCEDGREYYAVCHDADWDRIKRDDWLCRNVVPQLPLRREPRQSSVISGGGWMFNLDANSKAVKPKWVIRNEVREFLISGLNPAGERDGKPFYFDDDLPQLWADYAAYDHVALAQLFGKMIYLPDGIPMYTNEIEQAIRSVPGFKKPEQESGEHDALADARHNMRVLTALSAAAEAIGLKIR